MIHSTVGGEDYISNGGTLSFNEDNLSECFLVTILDDQLPEMAEFFSVVLSSFDPAAMINDPDADVRIDNNDSELLYDCMVVCVEYMQQTFENNIVESACMRDLTLSSHTYLSCSDTPICCAYI